MIPPFVWQAVIRIGHRFVAAYMVPGLDKHVKNDTIPCFGISWPRGLHTKGEIHDA